MNDNETSLLFKEFIEGELLRINLDEPNFDKFYNTLHSIFEKYLWCLPCHTHPAIADISIFDHLKSSSAIAACLYLYHLSKDSFKSKAIDNDDEKKFLLVGGDLSGIQNYIYQISAIAGEGGVAKRLRARSFYISALMEVIIIKILKALDLPISCNMVSAGGKFIILAPNIQSVKDRLADLYKEISEWLLKKFSGEICLIMDWSTEIQGNDFYRKKDKTPSEISSKGNTSDEDREEPEEEGEPDKPRKCNFRDRLDEISHALEIRKFTKFQSILVDKSDCGHELNKQKEQWKEERFKRSELYESYAEGVSDCRSCKKFPALYPDPHDQDNSEKVLCQQCAIDKIIGRKLLDAQYLAIGEDVIGNRIATQNLTPMKKWDSFFFFDNCYFVKPIENYTWESDFILLQRLRDHEYEGKPVDLGTVHRFLANYTPSFKEYSTNEPLCKLCKEVRPCEQITMMKRGNNGDHLYTFSCIAAASSNPIIKAATSSEPIAESEYCKGNQLIGVLKADVDNIGMIFSEGLKENLTISRYLTISRMVDLFFSGWMYRILKETQDYQQIYTVYSGGDDLVLVGPWEKVIYFAQRLNQEFKRFTCKNDENITISAGIAIVKPKHPISAAVALADKYLDMSKTGGKDRITLFDTTVKWSELDHLIEYKDKLNKGYEDFSDILTTGFIYRLLTYQQMYLDSSRDVKKLIFHSHMYYDVRRNITERIMKLEDEQKREWFNKNIFPLILKLYTTPVDKSIMNNLKIPVYWVLYKNRQYKKGGEEI